MFADVNGTQIYYEITGKGETFVLIAGLGCDHTYFSFAMPYLSKLGRMIALDLRGVGQSTKPAGPYTMELWAEDVNALLEHLGEGPAHIVGASLGGCVALALADRHPDKVKSLLLSAAFADLDRACEMNFRMRKAIVEQAGINEIMQYHVALWTIDRDFIQSESGWAAVKRIIHEGTLNQADPKLYIDFLDAILDFGKVLPGQEGQPKFTEKLPMMTFPTVAIVGEKDILTPVSFSKKIVSLMPNAKLVVLKDCAHITFVEKPEETCRAMEEFIKGLSK